MHILKHVGRSAMDRQGDMRLNSVVKSPLNDNARTNNAAGIAF